MIIEKINIKSFGKINNFSLDFSEGINVIEGQNESGKSTIAAFIKYMLYGFDSPSVAGGEADPEKPDERRKRLNWDTNTASGSMVVRVQDHRYLISRSTVPAEGVSGRIVYKEDASTVDMENGTPVFGKVPAGQVFFGVDRSLFENTAFIGQIGEADYSESSVKESIENILFSGNEKINTRRALNKLRDKATALRHEGNTGGVIFDLTKQKEKLETTLRETDEANRQILNKEAELHDIRQKRDEADLLREKLLDADICYGNVMLIQTFDRLHELEKESEEKAEAYHNFIEENARDGYVPRENYLEEVIAAQKEKKRAEEELAECEKRYLKEKSAIGITKEIEAAIDLCDKNGGEEELKQRAGVLRGGMIRRLIFAILSGLVVLGSLFAVFYPGIAPSLNILLYVAAGIGGIGAIFFSVLALAGKKHLNGLKSLLGTETYPELINKLTVIAEARAKRDNIAENIDRALSDRNFASEAYDRALRSLSVLVARFGGELPKEDVDVYVEGFIEEVRTFITEQNRLFEEKTNIEMTVAEIRRTLSSHSEIDVRAKVSPLKRKVLLGVNHENITSGIASAKADIAALDKCASDKEAELAELKYRAGDPSELYSRIQVLERKIEEQEDKFNAYGIAAKVIESAEEKLRKEISPRLGAYATEMMGIMTNNKYTDIDVSDGLRVSFMHDGQKKSADFLSGGTRDMTYIAVRFALMDMLYAEVPPLCFDESFAHQDNNRARAMMSAVAHLVAEKKQQSFIFTCNSRESTLATNIRPDSAVYKLTSRKTNS